MEDIYIIVCFLNRIYIKTVLLKSIVLFVVKKPNKITREKNIVFIQY